MDPTRLGYMLAKSTERLEQELSHRRTLILACHRAGCSNRVIAKAAGLSHTAIANIIKQEMDTQ